jgi:hypothetical protein
LARDYHRIKPWQEADLSFTVVIAFMALLAALSVYRIGGLNNNAVLRIWLGDNPVQNDLKRGLLGEK